MSEDQLCKLINMVRSTPCYRGPCRDAQVRLLRQLEICQREDYYDPIVINAMIKRYIEESRVNIS